jgi:hypothetical protein
MNHYQHETRTRQGDLADLPADPPAAARVAETRRLLAALGGPVWDAGEFSHDFEVRLVTGDYVYVTRRCDGVRGTLRRHEAAGLFYEWEAER